MLKHPRLLPRAAALGALLAAPLARARNPFEFQAPVTPVARETLYVHNLFLVIIAILFVLGMSFLLYSVYRHRKSRGHQPATFTGPTRRRQWVWIALPFVALVFIDYVVMGIPAYHAAIAMADTRDDAKLVVKATGSQWKWQYEYPGEHVRYSSTLATPADQFDGRAPKDPNYLLEVDHPLVLPVGEKVRILLTSTDVIHSWWVPAFGVKQDAVPGFLRETWVKIDKPGVYRGQCAELCGVGHAYMPIVVVAKAEPEFRAWLAKTRAAEAAAAAEPAKTLSLEELRARGNSVYEKNCSACHQANGLGIAGTFPPLAGGHPFSAPAAMTSALEQRGFYRDGKIVLGPVAKHLDIVLHGIPGTPMAAFGAQLSDADIAAVVTYERNDFGNHTGEAVQAADVRAARAAK
ncbi:MAG: cytochrome c oxidase subunit II [Betaproteobacteria bacterium]|nr:cytochrome c oxidase subunit II [Betaproteobacteria bacterium]